MDFNKRNVLEKYSSDVFMEKNVIKVAQIIGPAIDGGTEAFAINYYRNIDRTKVQFDFFVESESKIIRKDKIEAMGGKVVIIPSYKHLFKYIKTLEKLFKEGQYDIVHSNMNALSVFTLYAAKKAGIKIRIAHSHSTSNKKEWKKNIIKNILRPFSKKYATHYFACSGLAGRWLFGDKTYNQGKVTVINNAIDLERFKFDPELRKEMREELGVDKSYVIGHIGRFCEQKNHTFLIDIFNEAQKKLPNAKLLLIGNGELYDEIVAKVKELNLIDKVIFAGVHKHPERYYDAMDCFVLPSLYEGLPVVAVEAQVNGLKCYLSTEITREIGVLNTTEYIKIDSTAEWSDKLVCKEQTDREDGFKQLCDSKYNIVTEAKKLGELYDNFVKKNTGGGTPS